MSTLIDYVPPRYNEEKIGLPDDLMVRFAGTKISVEDAEKLREVTNRLSDPRTLSDPVRFEKAIKDRISVSVPDPAPYETDRDVQEAKHGVLEFLHGRRISDVCRSASMFSDREPADQRESLDTFRAPALLMALETLEVGGTAPHKEAIRSQIINLRSRDVAQIVIPYRDFNTYMQVSEADIANLAYVFAAIQQRATPEQARLIAVEIVEYAPQTDGPAIRLIWDIAGRLAPTPAHWLA